MRLIYFALSLLSATVAFLFLRRIFDWRIALVAGTVSLGLVPGLIFAPSYNTLSLISLSMATSLAGIGLLRKEGKWLFTVSGGLLVIAAVAYPTQIVTVLCAIGLLRWQTGSWRASAWMSAGAAMAGVALLVPLAPSLAGIPAFIEYDRLLSAQVGWVTGAAKLGVIAKGVVSITYLAPATYVMALVVVLRVMRRRVPAILAIMLPILAFVIIHVNFPFNRTMNAATLLFLAVLASGLGSLTWKPKSAVVFALAIGGCAGGMFAFASAGGFTQFGAGAAAVGAPVMAVLLDNIRSALSNRLSSGRALAVSIFVGVASVSLVVFLCWSAVFGSTVSPFALNFKAHGLYAGMLTTATIDKATHSMESDLAHVANSADRLFVYGPSSSSYLLSPARPVAPYLFMSQADGTSRDIADLCVNWMRQPAHAPTIVVVSTGIWAQTTAQQRDYLLEYFRRNYEAAVTRDEYVILRSR